MDRNGYNESLFGSEDGVCYVTGKRCDTARHEIFNKHARQYSKEDGLWIAVCPEAHAKIHANCGHLWDDLKKEAELLWLLNNWTEGIAHFVRRYGRNYL